MYGTYPFVGKYPTEGIGIKLYGIPERKSSVLIYEIFGKMKYKYRNREFCCRGYYVDAVGNNTKAIEEYIKHQLDEDKLGEQMTMLGNANDDPSTCSK